MVGLDDDVAGGTDPPIALFPESVTTAEEEEIYAVEMKMETWPRWKDGRSLGIPLSSLLESLGL